jgi:anti-sigma regulatory factor (Ser/Thr protein kinase)
VDRVLARGLVAFRWVAWAWMAAVAVIAGPGMKRPWLAVALIGAALAVTVWATGNARGAAVPPVPAVLAELAVGVGLVLGDGWTYGAGHAFSTALSLGSVWPLAGVLAAGVALGPWAGVVAGGALGVARMGAALANGVWHFDRAEVLSLVNSVVFYVLAGAVAGYLTRLIVRAEREISTARAREEVARTLHDGVLQTLAVVERRVADPELARLAREQERDLRSFLFGSAPPTAGRDLEAALRAAADRWEAAFGGRAQVLVADDLPALSAERVAALAGAAGEALTNAGKHGAASRVTVYAEPDLGGSVFLSVKDDGQGFDPLATAEGVGLRRSVRERMAEVGGSAEVRSHPGAGTEIILRVGGR